MTIDYLKCVIDGKPMELFVPGKKPTIQNTSNWKLEQKQKEEYAIFLRNIVKEIRGNAKSNLRSSEDKS